MLNKLTHKTNVGIDCIDLLLKILDLGMSWRQTLLLTHNVLNKLIKQSGNQENAILVPTNKAMD